MAVAHHPDAGAPRSGLPLEYSREDGELRIIGFWLFLTTDMVLFACLFATYTVLRGNTDGGPTGLQLFDAPGFMAETLILLTSSFTCGLAVHAMRARARTALIAWLAVTIALGLSFIGIEANEFAAYVRMGATMQRSGFLTAFFTLVGTHGCHVSLGILWMLSVLYQIVYRGIDAITARKVFIVGLYWHFLDVVWVFIFTVVYLTGVMT